MGDKKSDGQFWYQDNEGIWRNLGECTSLSLDISDEAAARLAEALIPLGELEIVPRNNRGEK